MASECKQSGELSRGLDKGPASPESPNHAASLSQVQCRLGEYAMDSFARHRGREIPNHLKPPLHHTLRGQEGAFRASLSRCLNTGLRARHNEAAFVLVCVPMQMHLDAKSKQTAFPLFSSVTHPC